MKGFIFFILVVFCFVMLFSSCNKTIDVTPAPEVEVVYFDPVGFYVDSAAYYIAMSEVEFRVWNYVDALITTANYEFRSVKNNDIIATAMEEGWGIRLSGGNEACTLSQITTVMSLSLDISPGVDYMYSHNDNVVVEITFEGVDDYSRENEFTCLPMHIALVQVPDSLSDQDHVTIPIETGGE